MPCTVQFTDRTDRGDSIWEEIPGHINKQSNMTFNRLFNRFMNDFVAVIYIITDAALFTKNAYRLSL